MYGRSAVTIFSDNQLDRLMKQAKGARKAEDRSSALGTSLLAAFVLLIDPDGLLCERRILMAKAAAAGETPKPVPQETTPPARDPKIAVEEEYQIARQRGTVQALELFIARHPEDPLAQRALADIRRISR
jgi:hypothetical protein